MLKSIYDLGKSWAENLEHGPFFLGEIPERPKPDKLIDFLGFKIGSPIGVPAGPLLNSRWIALAAKLGFDVPTYKTIRSFAYPGHPLPNMIYVEVPEPGLAKEREAPPTIDSLSLTNSFGMPSKSPEFLLEDIERANRSLKEYQVMIVSVVGTPNRSVSFAEDFVNAACLAKEGGAKIIEANFSCPNVGKAEGCLYLDPSTTYELARAIVQAIQPIPLIIKVSTFPSAEAMRNTFVQAARAGVRGIAGLNAVNMRVIDAMGRPALGEGRATGGICGSAIRQDALRFIRESAKIIRQEKIDLTLLGCGGILRSEHFDAFLAAGADIAMSATGLMFDPTIALRRYETIPQF